MAYEQLLLDGTSATVYTSKEWFDLFTEHCNKIYFERGSETGEYCCGYHWCCNECEAKICNCCADCVQTMIDILKSFGYNPDYSDTDFDALEERIRKLYESRIKSIRSI